MIWDSSPSSTTVRFFMISGSYKDILGIWIGENEGAKFWLKVCNELKNRGVSDILIACVDGLKGFPDANKLSFLMPRHLERVLCSL